MLQIISITPYFEFTENTDSWFFKKNTEKHNKIENEYSSQKLQEIIFQKVFLETTFLKCLHFWQTASVNMWICCVRPKIFMEL